MRVAPVIQRGFTLVELIIVMALMGILVTIVAGSFTQSMRRGRDNGRKSDLKNIATALEAYFSDKGRYPADDGSGMMAGCDELDAQPCAWGSPMQDSKGTVYMSILPDDPSSAYRYYYISDGTYYRIYSIIENEFDEGTGVIQTGYSGTNCSVADTIDCKYGIASSNTTP